MPRDIDLEVLCDGNRLLGGAALPDRPRGAVLLLHGIPSISPPEPGDLGYAGLAGRFAREGWMAAWVDMRGVRSSGGHFSIEGWVRDAAAALEALSSLDDVGDLPVAIVGSSAGGAVAAELARRDDSVAAVALLAAPAAWTWLTADSRDAVRRITEEAGMSLPADVMADPEAWADEFRRVSPEVAVPHVSAPLLVVHGTEDDVVPVEHARRIADPARSAELEILEGAGHQLRKEPRAIGLLLDWLQEQIG